MCVCVCARACVCMYSVQCTLIIANALSQYIHIYCIHLHVNIVSIST